MRERKVRTPGLVRRVSRVVYLDAADSWIAEERSPSAKTVWHTDYTGHLPTVWQPYGLFAAWVWRPAAVGFAVLLDSVKFLLIHPARGPLTISATFALYLIATH